MALTAEQVTQVFEVLGFPEHASGSVVLELTGLFGPQFESYDVSAVRDLLAARLAGLSASQEARTAELLARWSAIGATSPLTVAKEGSAAGTLADHPAERAHLRRALANTIGFAVAGGGFAAEAAARAGRGRIVR